MDEAPKAISIELADGTQVHFVVTEGVLRSVNSQPTHASYVRNHSRDAQEAQATAEALARHNGWI